jgi:hypothetical protein
MDRWHSRVKFEGQYHMVRRIQSISKSSCICDELAKKEKNYQNSDPTYSVVCSTSYPIFYFPLASKKKISPTSYHVFYLKELLDFIIFLLII